MDMMNPFEDPTEEVDPLTGQKLMPNVPRNPEDPREKLRSYLAAKIEAEKKMMSPEYRQAMRAPMDTLQGSQRDLAFQNLLSNASAQLGTVGGKAAPNTGMNEYTKQLQGLNQQAMQGIEKERAEVQGMEDQRGKMLQYLSDKYDAKEAATRKRELEDENMGLKRRMVRAAEMKADKTTEGGATEGFKALDKDFAKDFNEYTSRGRVNAASSISRLEAIQKQLEEEAKNTFGAGGGSIRSTLPDALRSEKSIELRDDTINAANSTLKELFGGALSDSERQAAASEFYNDKLDSASNAKRLKAKIQEMRDRMTEQDAKAEYFRKNGTLAGFGGTSITTRPAGAGQNENQNLSPLQQKALDWATKNPNDPRSAKILQKLGR